MEPPIKLGINEASYSGQSKVYITLDDRRRHILTSGRSGTGKTTFLANLVAQDANAGRGFLLIDPNGDLAENALDLIPPRRIRKTIYLNPSDSEWPIGFNVLDNIPADHRAAHASELVSAFRSLWGASWGPRLEHILYNCIAALLEMPGSTLMGIQRMLLSARYRRRVVAHVTDPIIHQFWTDEFPLYEKKFGAEATAPVLNKIGQLFSSPDLRNILGNPNTAFNPRYLMDNNYIVIANLSVGKLGTQHANLLGSLLIAAFGAAAMTRADTPEEKRKDFLMVIDEFPNFTTTALTTLLSQARKYHLSLVLAHQYLDQMSAEVKDAVLGNVGTLIVFKAGAQDAETFARELNLPNHFVTSTDNYKARCRLLAFGNHMEDVLLRTPPPPKRHGHSNKILAHSRMHFATDRLDIEARIKRFLAGDHPAKSFRPKAEPDW